MSSRRRERRIACTGKVRHDSQATAMSHVRDLRRADALSFGESKSMRKFHHMNAYPCRFCGGWHVGHTPLRVQQAIAARRMAK